MSLDMTEVRRAFPHLDSCLYLNTASVGLSWPGQGAAVSRFYDEDKAIGYDGRERWHAMHMKCRNLVAKLLHVAPETVSFASSTSEALNLVAGAMRFAPGEQIVLAEDEFPSVVLAWQRAVEMGAQRVRVSIPVESERTEALIAAISDRTRVVCVSHVHWSTGTRVDLQRIAAACRLVGARLLVDGVQAVGAVEVDASVADFYTASVFKWLLSGFGLAIMIARPEFEQTFEPLTRGYNNEPPSRHLRYSHMNYPGVYALCAALEYLESLGWGAIFDRVERLSTQLHGALVSLGLPVVTPVAACAGIISIAQPDAVECAARLARVDVRVEERSGLLRMSPHFYNTESEIERFVGILGAHTP